jgi:hypothetical protein
MVIVQQTYSGGGQYVPLYRHSDGYPTGCGLAILEVLRTEPECTEDILCRLMARRYDAKGNEGSGDGFYEPVYRAATWMPNDQGDLEYVYQIDRVRGLNVSEWLVTVYTRQDWQQDNHDQWPQSTYSMADFEAFINAELQAQAKRLAAMQRKTS